MKRNILNQNIETIEGFGDNKEAVKNSLQDIDDWIEKTRELLQANTHDEIQNIVRPWTSGHLLIHTPHGTRAERRVRKAFRNAAMRRQWEISSNVVLDEEVHAKKMENREDWEEKTKELEKRVRTLEQIAAPKKEMKE